MKYNQTVTIKNGATALLRNADAPDGAAVFALFNRTHEETDYLLSYPDENSFDVEGESRFLAEQTQSENAIEIVALLDGKYVGCAGINPVGSKYKVRHRAEFGISVLKDYWGLGVGRALAEACIECARRAGFAQLELSAVAVNERALSLYRSLGFTEYGRNPKGFNSRLSGYVELVYMRLEL